MYRVSILMKSGQWVGLVLESFSHTFNPEGSAKFEWSPRDELKYIDPDEIAIILSEPKRKSEWDG